MKIKITFILAIIPLILDWFSDGAAAALPSKDRSFIIDRERNTFVKDGVPFNYVGGSLHYWRVPPSYWQDRLEKMAACGLDVVTTYVNWALHEPRPGDLKFEGSLDVVRFLQLAHQAGLSVILRPGPYIDAETDLGGIPPWILKQQNPVQPDIFLRTSDPRFVVPVKKWFQRLFAILQPLVYSKGGPIIMVQVENEYGAYPACDKAYLKTLVDLTRTYLSEDVVLFSTDGNRVEDLECSKMEGVFSTIDFGVSVNPEGAFDVMRMFEPKGPLVNSEFYSGWLDYWGDHHHHVSTSVLLHRLEQMICDKQIKNNVSYAANVNLYMFHGGSSFGYVSGGDDTPYGYLPVTTSYDYDSPLTEAGDVTDKYHAICKVISKCKGKSTPRPPPMNSSKHGFGPVSLEYAGNVFDVLDVIAPFGSINSSAPVPMEFTEMPNGFILYSSNVEGDPGVENMVLSVPGLRDRAYVFFGENRNLTSILSRAFPPNLETILSHDGYYSRDKEVHFLVENQGRVAYGPGMNFDLKGILGIVKAYIIPLMHWSSTPLDIARMANLHEEEFEKVEKSKLSPFKPGMPAFFKGKFNNNLSQKVDTFMLPSSLRKGQLFVNGVNLGRYWPAKGPQQTLFIPRDVIKFGLNEIIVFELEPEVETPQVKLVDKPKLDKWA